MSPELPKSTSELDARLAALPAEEAPARDLWPGVLAAISAAAPARTRPWARAPFAVAAGLALAVTAGFAGWLGGRQSAYSVADLPAAGASDAAVRQASFAVPAGGDYLATRAELERAYRERLALLSPATRLRVERDLAVVRAANEDIRHALATDPQSAVLNRLLEGIWQQEFDLYSTVARSPDPADQRTRT
jgi:hypothetical protein